MQKHSNLRLNDSTCADRWQAVFELHSTVRRAIMSACETSVRKEVNIVEVKDFLEAVGASVVGGYLVKLVDYVVKAIKDRLNNH